MCVSLCVVRLFKLFVRVVCGLLRCCMVCGLFACFVVCLGLCVFGRFMCVLCETDRVMLYGVFIYLWGVGLFVRVVHVDAFVCCLFIA